MERRSRSLISTDDLTDEDLRAIVGRGAELASGGLVNNGSLTGQVAGIYFRMTSTRTRTAFSSGALRLGGQIIAYGPGDLQTNTGETTEDTGRVLSRMLDILVARTGGGCAELRGWAEGNRMSVINAMTAAEHPTQALADLAAMTTRFGQVAGLRVLYVGEGNNTAAALALTLSRYRNTELVLRTPPGYGVTGDVLARAETHALRCGAIVTERHDMDDLPSGFDVVYTTRWRTTGTSKPDPRWREAFVPFQVTADLWQGSPKAVFMHDLPAHRGEEVIAEVLDGPESIAFAQAEAKMHSAMAVMEWCRDVL
ncbi:ornithine carbamoyltransferase [Amycolatopsis sp. WAC 04169]|uniref:ornithine carbamoyltransferase n=1 Tax=Amycolatopsis sp. WAC 04169 TaxID=2203197 RepID=UPI000F7B75CA|nr:ornithine carbamoyltransferase [Amycolatopsis sp. WAC 04169]RSN29240.1 ornithine carbamoyltransferase [Amycolatopsis sp. WAC 04169]